MQLQTSGVQEQGLTCTGRKEGHLLEVQEEGVVSIEPGPPTSFLPQTEPGESRKDSYVQDITLPGAGP